MTVRSKLMDDERFATLTIDTMYTDQKEHIDARLLCYAMLCYARQHRLTSFANRPSLQKGPEFLGEETTFLENNGTVLAATSFCIPT